MGEATYGGTMLHYCQKMMAGEVPMPPVAQLIGMELAAVRPGGVVIELDAGRRHASPLGTVHGGSWAPSPMPPWAWLTPLSSKKPRRSPPWS